MIVFSQFNDTKPDGFMLFYCQILLNFQGAYALMHVRSLSKKAEVQDQIQEIYHAHKGVDGYRSMKVYLERKGFFTV